MQQESKTKIYDIKYSGDVIEGQENMIMSARKFKHPHTRETITYSAYMNYVEKGEAKHPEEIFATRIKYTMDVEDDNGIITRYKFDKNINPKGYYDVEVIDPNEEKIDWSQFEPKNLKPFPKQEDLPLSKRIYPEPYTGDEISYQVYMRHVREDEKVPTPQELYDKKLIRNPKQLRKNQKDLPNSKQLYVHFENGFAEYVGYGTYMKLVNEKSYTHPDKI